MRRRPVHLDATGAHFPMGGLLYFTVDQWPAAAHTTHWIASRPPAQMSPRSWCSSRPSDVRLDYEGVSNHPGARIHFELSQFK